MLLSLAVRNIWRNKRRTLITIAAVAFAVFLASVMRSFQKGAWDNVINNSVNLFFGYAQVHKDGFWDEQVLDNAMEWDSSFEEIPDKVPSIKAIVPRIESFALASSQELTQGVMVIGVDPQKEDALTNIAQKISAGNFLQQDDDGAVIAGGIAKKLKLNIGDTLVMISQGYHGANAAGKFPIRGIFNFPLPDLNKTLVYTSLSRAQDFYAAENMISSLVMHIDDAKEVSAATAGLIELLDKDKYEVMDYEELMPELVQARQMDEGGGFMIIGILYALITFAIFGTILMMTKERSYEFGVLTAIGMSRWKLFSVTFLESVMVGLIGVGLGLILAIPLVYYWHVNPINLSFMGEQATAAFENFGMEPIIPTAFTSSVFLWQAGLIFIITALLSLYPLFNILKLEPVKAMRS